MIPDNAIAQDIKIAQLPLKTVAESASEDEKQEDSMRIPKKDGNPNSKKDEKETDDEVIPKDVEEAKGDDEYIKTDNF